MDYTHATHFETLEAWNEGWYFAHLDSNAPFWTMDHMHLREKPRQGINEAMMVEKMWESMGPLEHAWFSRFMPDVQKKYPLETDTVSPWNASMAVAHYGMVPRFDSSAIDSMAIKRHPTPAADVGQPWRELRAAHGMETNCWQLTHEMIQGYHRRDALPITQRIPYQANIDEQAMAKLQTLCPSPDWTLALACAGIASDELHTAFQEKKLSERQHQAVAWLQWWLEKSPDCLDNLAWTWVLKTKDFVPEVQTSTALVLDLCQGAKDPRETFFLARQVYGTTAPNAESSIDSAALQNALGPHI